jgi:hypothetical protein
MTFEIILSRDNCTSRKQDQKKMSPRMSLRRLDKANFSQLFLCVSSDFKTKIWSPAVNLKRASGYAINECIKLSSRWLEDVPDTVEVTAVILKSISWLKYF